MARVRVSIPATVSSFGPGVNSIALALRLYETVELSDIDTGFSIEIQPGQPEAEIERARAAVITTVRTMCRKTGSTPSGLRVSISQENLAGRGLGLRAGFRLGCAIGINALCGGPLGRADILGLVLGLGCAPAPAVASLHGNLALADAGSPELLHAVVPVAAQEVIVFAPRNPLDGQAADSGGKTGDPGAISALVAEGLRSGDHRLLHDLSEHLLGGRQLEGGLRRAVRAALAEGASAIFVHEQGLSAVGFARSKHEQIGQAMVNAYADASGYKADVWVVPMETHGISIDAVDIAMNAQNQPVAASQRPVGPY